MISNRRHSLKIIANVHVDTDTRFVVLFAGDCACCFHPRLPVFCAVLQHVRHETMVVVGPGKRQGVCVLLLTCWYREYAPSILDSGREGAAQGTFTSSAWP